MTASAVLRRAGLRPQAAHAGAAAHHSKDWISMGFVAWVVVGAIAGFLASKVMRARESLLMMVVLGIVGGLVGGFVATTVLKMGTVNGINLESILIATLGAIAVVYVVHLATGSRGLLHR